MSLKQSIQDHTAENPPIPLEMQTRLIRQAYRVGEVAQMFGVASATVRRWISSGRLRRIPGCRHILVPATEITRFTAY